MRDEFGKMPTKDAILNEMKKYPTLNAGITDGAYILTGTTEGGGMWVYEVDSEKPGRNHRRRRPGHAGERG